jgi:hypothetical protein
MPASWRDYVKAPPARRVIRGYIDAFDPDVLVQFSRAIPDYLRETGLAIIRPQDVWEDVEGQLSPRYGIGIYELLGDIFDEYFKYKAKYPARVVIPRTPPKLSLFWASLFGEYPARVNTVIERNYLEPLEIQVPDLGPEKLQELMEGNVLFPRRITQRRLSVFNPSLLGRGREGVVFFCDGTKVQDIVDFWNLRALGKSVVPVPVQLQDEPQLRSIVIAFLKFHRRPWKNNPQVCDTASIIRARSRRMEEMQEWAGTLRIDREPNDPSPEVFFSLQHWYPRIWDEWARDKDSAVPADIYSEDRGSIELKDVGDKERAEIHFRPLLPDFAKEHGYHIAPRCANEISFRLYSAGDYLAEAFPASSGANFNRAISGTFRGDWRVGRNGLVKLVKGDVSEFRSIPTAESIVFAWLADRGWEPQLSAPGLLAKQIRRTLEGSPYLLSNERVLALFEHMNGGSVKEDGSPVENNKVSWERDLAVGEVKNRLGAASERGNPYDYIISRGIFRLGLRPQCPQCLRHSWFALENVRDTIACPKCLNVFPAAGNLDGAVWSYKTTGPFSVPNYADGAYAVLLTLEFFSEQKMGTLQTTPVLSFTGTAPNKRTLEADFALFWRESVLGESRDGIMFGECKTYGRFERRDFDRMRYLAETFPGAVLVFSTLRRGLSAKEVAGMARIAKRGRRHWKAERPINPVLILTGTELLDWSGPPFCWTDPVREKFQNVAGLLGICDATQQIYLNMASWHTEWREKWERKRTRWQAKHLAPAPGGT